MSSLTSQIIDSTSGADFEGETMNTIDMILNQIGQPTDGLGPNWSPLERVVHKFHMKDLWAMLKPKYDDVKLVNYWYLLLFFVLSCYKLQATS